jgi:hypothetical protein
MTTEIVVANRSGLAEGPDGTKYRLVRGRTLADARHPLPQAHPNLFSPYRIDLSYEGDDVSPSAAGDVSHDAAAGGDTWADKVREVEATAASYRTQLATIVDGLQVRGLVPAETDTTREGWLAELVFAVIDRQQTGADPETGPEAPEVSADRPRKRTPRRPAPRPAASDGE